MQIRLTVLAPPSGQTPARTCDVLVTAPAGTALATVASNLAAAVTGPDGSLGSGAVVLFAGRERLDAQRCALGEPPLVDGAVLSLQVPGEDEAADDAAPAQLHVVAGPDAGGVHLLHGGQIRIGRSADADVPLDDPDVSRLHCAVTVSEDGRVSVADLGSTNGTSLDGTEVHDRPVRLEPGALLRLGESTLRLAPGARTPTLATAPDGEGHLRVARASDSGENRNLPEDSASEKSRPGSGGYGSGHAYGAGVSPGFGSGEGVAHAYGNGVPAEAGDRGGQGPAGRATDDEPPRRGGIGAWARRLAGNKAEPVHEAAPDETRPAGRPVPSASSSVAASRPSSSSSVGETWPDPATVLLTALGPGPRLWERDAEHPEALVVRLGTTDRAELPAVPVTVGLREAGSLGLAGPRERLAGLARSVVAQLAALHSPADLEIVLISTDRARNADERRRQWAWLGWLPHLRPMHGQDCRLLLAYDREQATARTTELVRRLRRRTARHRLGQRRPGHGRRGRPTVRGGAHRGDRRRRPRFRGAARDHGPAGRRGCGRRDPSDLPGRDTGRVAHLARPGDVRGGLPCVDRVPRVRGGGDAERRCGDGTAAAAHGGRAGRGPWHGGRGGRGVGSLGGAVRAGAGPVAYGRFGDGTGPPDCCGPPVIRPTAGRAGSGQGHPGLADGPLGVDVGRPARGDGARARQYADSGGRLPWFRPHGVPGQRGSPCGRTAHSRRRAWRPVAVLAPGRCGSHRCPGCG